MSNVQNPDTVIEDTVKNLKGIARERDHMPPRSPLDFWSA